MTNLKCDVDVFWTILISLQSIILISLDFLEDMSFIIAIISISDIGEK